MIVSDGSWIEPFHFVGKYPLHEGVDSGGESV
jgi:hypothetical protein